jgi:peptidoglycan/xylan/chitin deacetylase (PgdA/CDA1 family)
MMWMQQIKSTARRAAAALYHGSGQDLKRLRGKAVILTYHRVLSGTEMQDQFVQPGMYVRDDVFEMQMRFLTEHFRILPLGDLLERWNRRTWDSGERYCVVTFDDGWRDNYRHAFPILQKYGIPATIFLPTAWIGTEEWFWPEQLGYLLKRAARAPQARELTQRASRVFSDFIGTVPHGAIRQNGGMDGIIEACKQLPDPRVRELIDALSRTLEIDLPKERLLMSWEDVAEMSKIEISFGSHSRTHRILTTLSPQDRRDEIEGSYDELRSRRISHVPVFCYPNGDYTEEIAREVEAAGYQAAVSTRPGHESGVPEDRFALKRIGVHNDISDTIPLFSAHIAGLNRPPRFGT